MWKFVKWLIDKVVKENSSEAYLQETCTGSYLDVDAIRRGICYSPKKRKKKTSKRGRK